MENGSTSFLASVKAIRRLRDAMIAYSFVPITILAINLLIYSYQTGIKASDAFTYALLLVSVALLSFTVMLFIGQRFMLGLLGKGGLCLIAASVVLFLYALFAGGNDYLTLSLLFYAMGQIAYVIDVKVDMPLKVCHVAFYVIEEIFLVIGIFSQETAAISAILVLLFPILSSYLSVRWASREFLRLK